MVMTQRWFVHLDLTARDLWMMPHDTIEKAHSGHMLV